MMRRLNVLRLLSHDVTQVRCTTSALIYIETGAFRKGCDGVSRRLSLKRRKIPSRHIALAKAYEKMGSEKACEELERAFALDQAVSTLRLILAIHEKLVTSKRSCRTCSVVQKIADNTARREAESKLKRDIRSVIRRPKKILCKKLLLPRFPLVQSSSAGPSLTPSKPRSSTAIRPSSNHPSMAEN